MTLSTQRFLDYILCYRSDPSGIHGRMASIEREDAEQLKLEDPNEELCHVELTSDSCGCVWPIKVWRESEEKRLRMKRESEARRANKELLATAEATIATNLQLDPLFGAMLSDETAVAMARKIMRDRKFARAKQFGVDNLEELMRYE